MHVKASQLLLALCEQTKEKTIYLSLMLMLKSSILITILRLP